MLRRARNLIMHLHTLRFKGALVTSHELVGTLVDVNLVLRTCYKLTEVRLGTETWKDSSRLFATLPVPAKD